MVTICVHAVASKAQAPHVEVCCVVSNHGRECHGAPICISRALQSGQDFG